jgi:hypothetical protein
MSTINWADLVKNAGDAASNTNYEPLPDGDYELKVIQVETKTTQTGKTMFKITNEVNGGPYAKRRIWDQLVVTLDNKKAMEMFFLKTDAMGIPRNFFEANPSNAQIEQALTGRTYRGTLGKRTYNGKESNEIKRYYAIQTATAATPYAAPTTAGAAVPPPPPAPSAAPAPAPAPAPAAPVSSEEPF